MNGFMYGNVYDDNDRFERQAVFPKLLCNNAEDFSLVGLTWLSSFILNKILKSSYHFMIKFDNIYSSFSVRMKTTLSYHGAREWTSYGWFKHFHDPFHYIILNHTIPRHSPRSTKMQ